jgi:FkbM family methyltransferase
VGRFPVGAVALDIGANIGNHAISLAKSFAVIHAFEPNPSVLARMRRNIGLNNIKNIETHGVGLGKADAQLPFKENLDGNLGASGFLKPGEIVDDKARMLHLDVAQADRFLGGLKLDRLDFVKIDVEGWEPDVFEGLTTTVARFRPIIAFEFHGGSAPVGDFQRIVATLPGYVIAEARYAPADASLLNKIAWNTVHKGKPTFEIFQTPEARTYENIFAFPDDAAFRQFAEG